MMTRHSWPNRCGVGKMRDDKIDGRTDEISIRWAIRLSADRVVTFVPSKEDVYSVLMWGDNLVYIHLKKMYTRSTS